MDSNTPKRSDAFKSLVAGLFPNAASVDDVLDSMSPPDASEIQQQAYAAAARAESIAWSGIQLAFSLYDMGFGVHTDGNLPGVAGAIPESLFEAIEFKFPTDEISAAVEMAKFRARIDQLIQYRRDRFLAQHGYPCGSDVARGDKMPHAWNKRHPKNRRRR